ncbi:MAG: hypothetical protein DMF61_04870 [Blastocatellia bacterium AA13]|nr:MAG: hypothetical protein DMF61_04870 [Blastocatellia bacterium AA13]
MSIARSSLLISFLTAGLLLTPAVFSQQKQHSAKDDDEPVKLRTTLVQVPVIVSETGGRYIPDLRQSEFELFEDTARQSIEFFGSIEQPFNVALLLDCSGSTAEQLGEIKAAALAFIDNLRPQDRVMVVAFNDSVEVLCPMTGERETLRRAISSVRSGEYTQVYEAVYTTIWEKLKNVRGRKAVIVFTDGVDTASTEIDDDDSLDAVAGSQGVIVYPIRYGTRQDAERKLEARVRHRSETSRQSEAGIQRSIDEGRHSLDRVYRQADEYLQELADLSGGVVERADKLKDLKAAFGRIADELRHQYLLGYYPPDESTKDRKITIHVTRPGAVVRARPGYTSAK